MHTKSFLCKMMQFWFVFLLVSVPGIAIPPGPGSSSFTAPLTVDPSAPKIQSDVNLHGWVKDLSGNPIPSQIYVRDRQGNVFADFRADDGTYSFAVPEGVEMAVLATPLGSSASWIDMGDGYHISRYFELTKTFTPTSDSEVNFTLPPSAALRLAAYNPEGDLMNFDDFYNAVNPSGFYGYDTIYGVFPLSNIDLPVPSQPSIGMLRWAWPQDNDRNLWEPCFGVPTGEAFYIMSLWEVPGIGTFPLHADNQGVGYVLNEGETKQINLVYEFAETEHRRTLELKASYEAQGRQFSTGLVDFNKPG